MKNLKIMNRSLLCKWLWRFYNPNENELWKEIIKANHNNRRTNISLFWKEVLKELDIFSISTNKKLGKGSSILFLA
jgi:hypothetical protein